MKNRGFIGLLLLIIIGLALLKYFFNWSIFDALASDQGKVTVNYIQQVLNTIWFYIGVPVSLIWNQVVWPLLSLAWNNFQRIIEMGKSGAQGI